MDLAVLIPSRNEQFLQQTIDSVLANLRGDTEIIAVADGCWPDPPVPDHPRVQLLHMPDSIGQRAATNLAARVSQARYVMKLDAHCTVAEGFDVELVKAGDELGKLVTQIPRMYNLHAFDRICLGCGGRMYQGPSAAVCEHCKEAKGFRKEMIWAPRMNRLTDFARFDHELHFQYWGSFKNRPEAATDLAPVMSSVGACFVMRRDRFWELGGLDELHGSWGQFGTEIACKSWLSGGEQVVNKRTWFAHMFRTQGGDFGFPYHNPESKVQAARAYSRKLWIDGQWSGTKRPLRWLIEKFAPLPDWTPERIAALKC